MSGHDCDYGQRREIDDAQCGAEQLRFGGDGVVLAVLEVEQPTIECAIEV
jgi:hypothetical protein